MLDIKYCLNHKEKKKGGNGGIPNVAPREQDNSEIRLLGDWKPAGNGVTNWRQNIGYTIPIVQ